MDLFQALRERRSCRNYDSRPVEPEKIQQILEAGGWAPSVMNKQPWRFIVIQNQNIKEHIKFSCEETLNYMHQVSGWKWLGKYPLDYLMDAPVLIAVIANPKDTGAEQFLPDRGEGYAFSCCAAIQNMLLAAHGLGLASLWFSLYEKDKVREIIGISPEMDLVSMIVLGYAAGEVPNVPRKPVAELTTVVE